MTISTERVTATSDPIDRTSRSVLHVLPHPGGGGETYVDALEAMEGYRFERLYIASDPSVRRPDRLAAAGLRANRAARAHDLLHVHGEVAALACLPALATRPSVLTLHGVNLLRRSSGIRRHLAKLNLRLIVAAADRTICVSRVERDEVVDTVGASLARRVVLILNGVPLPDDVSTETRRAVRDELGIAQSAVVAVCVGDLTPLKDQLTAARAALEVARGRRSCCAWWATARCGRSSRVLPSARREGRSACSASGATSAESMRPRTSSSQHRTERHLATRCSRECPSDSHRSSLTAWAVPKPRATRRSSSTAAMSQGSQLHSGQLATDGADRAATRGAGSRTRGAPVPGQRDGRADSPSV